MMGVVYEAHDPSLNRPLALKVARLLLAITDAEKETFERRFLSEAGIAARLSHPGLVVVHDIGRDPETGILYIALERLQGKTLAEMTGEGTRLPWREALEITARVAEALDYAHGRGVAHRDIKPANLMVVPTGEPKIMDFGLAKHEEGHELTAAGQYVGTPLFMAPEQVLGQAVDGRTDLFSLGSVLYTLLTGTRAFAADSVHRIMSRVAHQDPRPVSEIAPEVPPVLDDVLFRAMAKDRSDRYPTGKAFADDLDDVLAGRAPRHLAGWKRPSPAEGTMVSTRPGGSSPDANLPELSLSGERPLPSSPAPARRRRGARRLRALALGFLLAPVAPPSPRLPGGGSPPSGPAPDDAAEPPGLGRCSRLAPARCPEPGGREAAAGSQAREPLGAHGASPQERLGARVAGQQGGGGGIARRPHHEEGPLPHGAQGPGRGEPRGAARAARA